MKNAIKDFVVNVLGCGCPEEVFSDIRLDTAPGPVDGIEPSFEIRIGGRLMVLGVAGEKVRSSEESLATIVAAGMGARDGEGFNRVRIVVVSDDPECEAILRPRFAAIAAIDDRVHIHVVKKALIEEMLSEKETGRERGKEMEKYKTEPTVWHEMEGPFIGGREHYQEKSYGGLAHLQEAEAAEEMPQKPDAKDADK